MEMEMKKEFKQLTKLFVMGIILFIGTQPIYAEVTPSEKQAKLKLAKTAYACGFVSERITKDYLYAGNKVGVRQTQREMKSALQTFEEKFKILNESINDEKNKNLLVFMEMSFEELRDLVKQPYSLDNAQIALDLSATILEGARFIANGIKKSINHTDKNMVNGMRAYFEAIATYYMAYQAGVKDDNTIRLMKETVKAAGDAIDTAAKDPRNTVAMNQRMNKVQRLWGVVYKFYLDIDKGGLPFIVYKTSRDLNKNISAYSTELLKTLSTKASK